MFVVGLTGGIGTGKSTVTRWLRSRGYPVIDADEEARNVVRPGTRAYRQLRQAFGPEFFEDGKKGELRREALAAVVFQDEQKRRQLNGIVHPAVQWAIFRQILAHFFRFLTFREKPLVFVDIPLLFETGVDRWMSRTLVVVCSEDEQLRRVLGRDGGGEDTARARISAQMPLGEKCARTSFIVDNNGPLHETFAQMERILVELEKSAGGWRSLIPFAVWTALIVALMTGLFLLIF